MKQDDDDLLFRCEIKKLLEPIKSIKINACIFIIVFVVLYLIEPVKVTVDVYLLILLIFLMFHIVPLIVTTALIISYFCEDKETELSFNEDERTIIILKNGKSSIIPFSNIKSVTVHGVIDNVLTYVMPDIFYAKINTLDSQVFIVTQYVMRYTEVARLWKYDELSINHAFGRKFTYFPFLWKNRNNIRWFKSVKEIYNLWKKENKYAKLKK